MNYSLDEQMTGDTWIDGRPIYQKTIKVENISNDPGVRRWAHGIEDLYQVIRMAGISMQSDGSPWSYCAPWIASAFNEQFYTVPGEVGLDLQNTDTRSPRDFYVTLYYTKTTDALPASMEKNT